MKEGQTINIPDGEVRSDVRRKLILCPQCRERLVSHNLARIAARSRTSRTLIPAPSHRAGISKRSARLASYCCEKRRCSPSPT